MSPPSTSSSSHLPSFFRPSTDHRHPPLPLPSPPPPKTLTGKNTNLATCLYQTTIGIFSLTWSNSFLGHSLHLLLYPTAAATDGNDDPLSPPSSSFHLQLKPFTFWRKQGSRKLPFLLHRPNSTNKSYQLRIYWDLTKAKFGSPGPEPTSGFFIAAMVDQELVLLIGDLTEQALLKTKSLKTQYKETLILKKEHVFGKNVYNTRARFGGKNREISMDCSINSDAKLCFSVDKARVLVVKRLKWKFRGSEKVEVDGVPVNISWDVYNWFFEGNSNNGHAVFMFKFEDLSPELEEEEEGEAEEKKKKKKSVVLWKQKEEDFETWRRRRRRTAERSLSLSSISMSSASSSGCSSSVMEWSSVEEEELLSPVGFSLLVYAWRK